MRLTSGQTDRHTQRRRKRRSRSRSRREIEECTRRQETWELLELTWGGSHGHLTRGWKLTDVCFNSCVSALTPADWRKGLLCTGTVMHSSDSSRKEEFCEFQEREGYIERPRLKNWRKQQQLLCPRLRASGMCGYKYRAIILGSLGEASKTTFLFISPMERR